MVFRKPSSVVKTVSRQNENETENERMCTVGEMWNGMEYRLEIKLVPGTRKYNIYEIYRSKRESKEDESCNISLARE